MTRLYETKLTPGELERYSRQIVLPDIGVTGQCRLRDARVLVVGLGGLGSPVLVYLCSAGVGIIGIVDHDTVEIHNLQRQIVYTEESVGRPKTECAETFARHLNSSVQINTYCKKLCAENIASIAENYHVVVDCTDSGECRYLISDYCKASGKDMVLASVLRLCGQIFVLPAGSPCFRCLFPEKRDVEDNCDEAGVLGALCGAVGSLQALEVVKMLLQRQVPSIITYDAMGSRFRNIKLRCRSSNCGADSCNHGSDTKKAPAYEKHMVTWTEYLSDPGRYYVVDVRKRNLFEVCHIKDSVNIPIDCLNEATIPTDRSVLLVCRKGISAQKAWNLLCTTHGNLFVAKGGLMAFKSEVNDGGFV